MVDHRLDGLRYNEGRVYVAYNSLSHVSRRPCGRNKQYSLMNDTATHQWTIVYDASHRSYVEDKLSKNHSDLQYGDPYRHQKWRNLRMRHSCKFFYPSARDIIPSKTTCFPYRGLPWGLSSRAIHFRKFPSS